MIIFLYKSIFMDECQFNNYLSAALLILTIILYKSGLLPPPDIILSNVHP